MLKFAIRSFCLAALVAGVASGPALAQKAYDPGVSDTEIKLGITAALSGPASSYGVVCQANDAYFRKLNEAGGINGRKLVLLCRDDAFSPPKTVEQTRKLVESDEVFMMYNSSGTGTQAAVQAYLANKKVPQFLVGSGSSRWEDPVKNPWAISSTPHYRSEAVIFANHIMKNSPNAKVGLLYQSDDFGKEYLEGLKHGFGEQAPKYLIATQPYELSSPTVDAQIVQLKAEGVDVVVLGALAKAAAQSIRKIGELGWKPKIYLTWASTSIDTVLTPAGLDHAKDIISTAVLKDPDDPSWKDDKEVIEYREFMKKYFPGGDISNLSNVIAYTANDVLVDVLKKAGDNLTRENIRNLGQNIDVKPRMFIDGIKFKTTPTDLDPIKTFQPIRFDGVKWQRLGDPISPK